MNTTTFEKETKKQPIKIEYGQSVFLFTDEFISHHARIQRKWMQAQVMPDPILIPEKPWEGRALAMFGTVLKLGDIYRMYYTNWINGTQDLLLAESYDGLQWQRSKVGTVEYNNDTDNNIIMLQHKYRGDSPSLAYDEADKEYPFKLVYSEKRPINYEGKTVEKWCLNGYRSKDGLSFEPIGKPLISGDRCNLLSHRADGKFELYMRSDGMDEEFDKRVICRVTTEDFSEWNEAQKVLGPDLNDDMDAEFYGMSVFVRHGWRIGLFEYWNSSIDRFEIRLAFSKDGINWSRPSGAVPFISPSYEWNKKWNSCASNGPIILNEQMAFIFGGRRGGHNYDTVNYSGVIGIASIPVDRFCALEAGPEGFFVTVPISWPGGELVLNADTRESFESHGELCNGVIRVEVLNADGTPLEGYSGTDAAIYSGNTHARKRIKDGTVKWSNGKAMDSLKDKVIRICFRMRHARLFTFGAI